VFYRSIQLNLIKIPKQHILLCFVPSSFNSKLLLSKDTIKPSTGDSCLQSYLLEEAEIRNIVVPRQPGQIVPETPISKITTAKWTELSLQV
jgi:hypothetical protein